MKEMIIQKLKEIQEEYQISILYACESGSRAWGFASPDSDYDIRFIYMHDINWYLSINDRKDSIDFPVDDNLLDIGGWELRKTLKLIAKSNATPFEWLQSPIKYVDNPEARKMIWKAGETCFNPKTLIHHYTGIAKNAFLTGVSGNEIKIKKYFYVLRPLFAAIWVTERNEIPPMEFKKLLAINRNENILKIIDDLYITKINTKEAVTVELIPELQEYIEYNLERCKLKADKMISANYGLAELNILFRKLIGT